MDYEVRVLGFINALKKVAETSGVISDFGSIHLAGTINRTDKFGIEIYGKESIGLQINVIFESSNEGKTETVTVNDANNNLIVKYAMPTGDIGDAEIATIVTEAYLKNIT